MPLPKKLDWAVAQDRWASQLEPIIANPANNSFILKDVLLSNGTTAVNHRLGKVLQGWKIVRQRAQASIYDEQDSNQTPALTLVLVSDAAVSVDICVF